MAFMQTFSQTNKKEDFYVMQWHFTTDAYMIVPLSRHYFTFTSKNTYVPEMIYEYRNDTGINDEVMIGKECQT